MRQIEIIDAFDKLGKIMGGIQSDDHLLEKAYIENKWFTPESQIYALQYWAKHLNKADLMDWLEHYQFSTHSQKIGLVMAGNLPLVGLHDLICILLSGHVAVVKLSSDDTILIQWVIFQLILINPEFKNLIKMQDNLKNCDAIIATGSNNTARYFNAYFSSIPRIIRKNRNSLAILSGNETEQELADLAKDIFLYFGLGCRNVSKLLVPESYNFNKFFEAIEPFNHLLNHNKYYNNYTYHKAILLMNLTHHLDNGFIVVKEDERIHSPLGCIFFSYYNTMDEVSNLIERNKEVIQIVVGNNRMMCDCVSFGQSQNPKLDSYADGENTLTFLNRL